MAKTPHRVILTLSALALGLSGVAVHALEELQFSVMGADKALEKELRGASGLIAAQAEKRVEALDLFADARAEYGRLLSALYAAGHYGPDIHVTIDGREAAGIAPLDAPDRIGRIVVTVDPGPEFTFGRAQVGPLPGRVTLPEGFAVGKPAEAQLIKDAVREGIESWRDRGYAKAKVGAQDLQADHGNSTLNANIEIDPGPVMRFGPLTVKGAVKMRAKRVVEIAGLPEGQQFDAREAARAAERLRRSGVFSSVTLSEDDAITPPDLLGITADLVEMRQRRYSFGAEISSADGAVISADWLNRNLAGGGERLSVFGKITGIGAQNSGVDYSLGFTLDRPATPGPNTTLNLASSVEQINDTDQTSKIGKISAGFTQYFTDNLTGTIALSYEASAGADAAGDFAYRSLDLPLGIVWDRRDSKTEPTELGYLELDAKPFFGFGRTENGARLSFDARGYKALDKGNRVVLAARLQGGAVLGASLLGTPRDDLFYSGGGGTVRGQPYQSLGVTVDDGGTAVGLGGNRFAAGSLEARVKVTDKIGVVGFFDMGLVGAEGMGSDYQSGAGLGLRYATGVGPVRLDLAAPVHGTGKGVQIYIGLGQAF